VKRRILWKKDGRQPCRNASTMLESCQPFRGMQSPEEFDELDRSPEHKGFVGSRFFGVSVVNANEKSTEQLGGFRLQIFG
jgi:hypothetical protein